MSSTGLPTLTIDVADRRGERRIAVGTLAIAPLAISFCDLPAAEAVLAALVFVASLAFTFRYIGWIDGRERLARIICQSNGCWLLQEASGRTIEAELSPSSRVSARALWLRFKGRALQPTLLFAGDIGADEYRRLLVRLRLAPFPPRDEHPDVL